jgi:sec-independent protein translocase protein TatA
MFENVGSGELLVILLVILVLFGGKKIPEIAQGIGKGIREFKKAVNSVEDEIKEVKDLKNIDKKDPNDIKKT